MSKRTQPEWQRPEDKRCQLKLYNSLTRQKEYFVPQFGNKVLWYSCGPTVYDAAHLGHARSYIAFDILRRVLSDYFFYDVFYVMNITDIDDKIIKRARQTYLFDEYVKNNSDLSEVLKDVHTSLEHYKSLLNEDEDKAEMIKNIVGKTEKAIQKAEKSLASRESNKDVQSLLDGSKDILSEWLDVHKGKNVHDNSIFSSLPEKYEESFFEDMDALNVLTPDAVTRVSEYIPEIISYVQKIIENGFAYESNNSVYFDTMKFDGKSDHFYGKLVPEAFGDVKKLQEGEGDLSVSAERLSEKKHPSDFAIWKASKPGEPYWESPWGKGRPGWHIECSVMASALLGESLDIHTGGFDLKFPHHDNELAQAEAYYNNDHWVRYFLHSGHLAIAGCKMSKSLKNFVTIKDALKHHSSKQIRLAFLLHSWKDTLDYSPKTLEAALHYERIVSEFILNVKARIRDIPKYGRAAFQKWQMEEKDLHTVFEEKKARVHEALCDNIDTRTALFSIQELITESNKYINSNRTKCNRKLLEDIMTYILKILKIFGANFSDFSRENTTETSNTQVNEDAIMPYLDALADFRETVRQKAKEAKVPSVLKVCDELRDNVLPALGVRLEDQEGMKAAIKLFDPTEFTRMKEMQRQAEEEAQLEKENMMKEMEATKAKKEDERKIPPYNFFKSKMKDKYSKFDEKGMPTHDASGKDLSNTQLKKVKKMYIEQERRYNNYLKMKA